MKETLTKVDKIIYKCKEIFYKKMKIYNLSWLVLNKKSLIDKIFIKIKRVRKIQYGNKKINENIIETFISIINYSLMFLIKNDCNNISKENILIEYDNQLSYAKKLMIKKNHDYDESWKDIELSSIIDIIFQKIIRIKSLEKNDIKDNYNYMENYLDIINYSFFSIIKIENIL